MSVVPDSPLARVLLEHNATLLHPAPLKDAQLDPLPIGDGVTTESAPMNKMSHLFEQGQRIRIIKSGLTGTIETVFPSTMRVKLDSGHMVDCSKSECEPENFHAEGGDDDGADKMFKNMDPLPVSVESGTFVKSKSGLRVGARVKDADGNIGEVVKTDGVAIEVKFKDGSSIGFVRHFTLVD